MCNTHGQDKHYGNVVLWLAILLRLMLPFLVWVLGGFVYPKVEDRILKLAIIVCVVAAARDLLGLWERRPRL
jgi:hypothetical protein